MIFNLRGTANSVTRVLNPNLAATLFVSTGFTTVNFKQVPTYDQQPVKAQVQPLSSKDLRLLDSLNIQGAEKSIYLNGVALGINRVQQLGGDLIVFAAGLVPEGTTWKILAQLEQWGPTWAHVAVALQDDVIVPN